MNLGGKRNLDALLGAWPAPMGRPSVGPPAGPAMSEQDEERRWEERADAIVKAALENKGASGGVLDALLGSPALAPEPGESGVLLLSGEKKMAEDEKEPGAPSIPSPPVSTAAPPTERKRTSLKEIAARASQSGARPSTVPPSVSTPRPPSVTPLPRPVEATKEDSGVINLDVVRSSVTAQQAAAAEKAKPGQQGLFDDEKTVESATSSVEPPVVAKVTKPVVAVVEARAKKSNAGAFAGGAIALLGIAAALAIVLRKPPAPAHSVVADARPAVSAAAPTLAPPAAPSAIAAPQPGADATTVASADPAPMAGAVADGRPADPGKVAPLAGALQPTAPGTANSKDPPVDPKLAAKGAPAGGPAGDLQSEMVRAVGPSKDGDKNAPVAPVPEPAAGGGKNQNIPEQPSQGSVQAAMGAVMGGAKACVAGADDISRAQVTFSSSGAVTSVSVTGWAAAHGKSGCVQAALKAAKVGQFSKLSFSVGVPIRP